ncbi:MAG: glycosyltransferase family 39 protein [Actinomycetota bacterium]
MKRVFAAGISRIDPAIVALTILAFGVASYRLGTKSLWLDEAYSADFARLGLSGLGKLVSGGNSLNAGGNGGLYFVLLNFWAHLFGYSETALRSLTVLLGGLSVPVMVLLGTRLFSRGAGLVAGLLLALSPFFVHYEQTARTYALVVLLVLLSSYFFVREMEQPSRARRVGFVLASSLAFYAHYFAAFVLLVQFLTLLAVKRRGAFTRDWLVAGGAIAILCAPELLTVGGQPAGTRYSTSLISLSSALAGGGILLIALVILACYGLARAVADRRLWPAGFVAAWFLVPVLLVFAISKHDPRLFNSYYLIVVLPALLLLAAAGLARLPGRATGIITLGLLIICSGVGISDWYRQPPVNDYRAATRYFLAHEQPGDAVVYYPWWLRPGFAYYEALAGRSDPTVAPSGSPPKRIWLVLGGGAPPQQTEQFIGGAYTPVGMSPASSSPSVYLYRTKSTPSTTQSTSKVIGPNGVVPSAVAACLKAGGAQVQGPKPAGFGKAVYAVTPDSAVIGVFKAPNLDIAGYRQTFSSSGFQIVPLKADPAAFGIIKGKATPVDLALLSRCT